MKLDTYIRKEQNFKIFIFDNNKWNLYDPSLHGSPESIKHGYIVAYNSGEIVEDCANSNDLPDEVYYIEDEPYKIIKMPECIEDNSIVSIIHEPSNYHSGNYYCTKLTNTGSVPFRVNRFAAFEKPGLFRGYRLSTISNAWFSHEQFMNWYNVRSEWIEPGETVADQDNYGLGNGYWVFEIECSNNNRFFVKEKRPTQRFNSKH